MYRNFFVKSAREAKSCFFIFAFFFFKKRHQNICRCKLLHSFSQMQALFFCVFSWNHSSDHLYSDRERLRTISGKVQVARYIDQNFRIFWISCRYAERNFPLSYPFPEQRQGGVGGCRWKSLKRGYIGSSLTDSYPCPILGFYISLSLPHLLLDVHPFC